MLKKRGAALGILVAAIFGGVAPAQAIEPESSAKVISPRYGRVSLRFFEAYRRIEERATIKGHAYHWVLADGATGTLLHGAEGAHCPRYRQVVRATPRRVTFGWSDRTGELVGVRWIARACLNGGGDCALHEVKG